MKPELRDLPEKLSSILSEQSKLYQQGKVADYIPALAEVNPALMGVSIATMAS